MSARKSCAVRESPVLVAAGTAVTAVLIEVVLVALVDWGGDGKARVDAAMRATIITEVRVMMGLG